MRGSAVSSDQPIAALRPLCVLPQSDYDEPSQSLLRSQ